MTLVPEVNEQNKTLYNGPFPANEIDRAIDSGLSRGISMYYDNSKANIREENPYNPALTYGAVQGNRMFSNINDGFGMPSEMKTKDLSSTQIANAINDSRQAEASGASDPIKAAAESVLDPSKARESYRRKGKSGYARQENFTARYRVDNGKLKVKRSENGLWKFIPRPTEEDIANAKAQGCDVSQISEKFLPPAVQGAMLGAATMAGGTAGIITGYNTKVGRVIAVIIIVVILIIASFWVANMWTHKDEGFRWPDSNPIGEPKRFINEFKPSPPKIDEKPLTQQGGDDLSDVDADVLSDSDYAFDDGDVMTGGKKISKKSKSKPAASKSHKPSKRVKLI